MQGLEFEHCWLFDCLLTNFVKGLGLVAWCADEWRQAVLSWFQNISIHLFIQRKQLQKWNIFFCELLCSVAGNPQITEMKKNDHFLFLANKMGKLDSALTAGGNCHFMQGVCVQWLFPVTQHWMGAAQRPASWLALLYSGVGGCPTQNKTDRNTPPARICRQHTCPYIVH